jgi:hypothetical protein
MKAALISLALLGGQSALPVADRVPHLNVEALCKATAADDKANGVVLGQSVESCMRDETAAQQQLATIWSSNAGPVRDRCEAEAMIGDDSQSYVDLLSCMQAAGLTNTQSPAVALRGASKHRNAK